MQGIYPYILETMSLLLLVQFLLDLSHVDAVSRNKLVPLIANVTVLMQSCTDPGRLSCVQFAAFRAFHYTKTYVSVHQHPAESAR